MGRFQRLYPLEPHQCSALDPLEGVHSALQAPVYFFKIVMPKFCLDMSLFLIFSRLFDVTDTCWPKVLLLAVFRKNILKEDLPVKVEN